MATNSTDTGMERMLSRFADFAGGVEPPAVTTAAAPSELTYVQAAVSVPHINGQVAGTIVDVTFEVRIQQLELAPPEDLLYSQFQADQEITQQRERYRQVVDDLGENVPALLVLPIDRSVTIGNETLPMYRVYHDPLIFGGIVDAGRIMVRVRIPHVRNAGELLLLILSQQQHLREPSRLELADVCRRLSEAPYKYAHEVIARHLARDEETGKTPSDAYVSNLVSVSRLPEPVRQALHLNHILFSHARLLAQRCADNPVLCEQLAAWVAQDKSKRQTVQQLTDLLNLLLPLSGRPLATITERDGQIFVQRERPLQLAAPPRETPALHYTYLMAAKAARIRQEAQRRHVAIVPHTDPDKIALTPDTLHALADDLSAYTRNVPVRDVEAVLLGFLEATRRSLANANLLNEQGIVAPVIDGTLEEA